MHIADLFEFKASFQRKRIVKAAADKEAALGVHIAAGKVFDLLAVRQTRLDDLRCMQQLRRIAAGLRLAQSAARIGQTQGKQVQHTHLHRVSLGGGHSDLRPRIGVHHVVGRARNGAAHHIHDGKHRHAAALGQLECCQRVTGLAGLADDDDQIVLFQNRVPVAELAGNVHLGGHTGQRFNGRFAHHAGMHRRAAAHQMHPANAAQHLVRQRRDAQLRHSILHTGAHCGRDGGRLLVDLLEHEVGVAALLSRFHIPVCRELLAFHRLTKFVVEADALSRADGHIALFQHAVFPGIFEQRGDIRCDKVFAFSPADDQRAFPLDRKNSVRVIEEQHRQRVAAAHLGKGLLQRPQRVAGIAAVDQLYQHFRVGLALEGIALCSQPFLEQPVIFNDAVVHDAHTRRGMRVAVHIAGLAMGSPPGVADAAEALCQLLRCQLFPQGCEPPLAFYYADSPVQRKRHTGGIISAILQLFQTIQQHILCIALTDITNDAAHTKHLHTDRSHAERRSDARSALLYSLCSCMAFFEGICCGIAAVFCPSLRLV